MKLFLSSILDYDLGHKYAWFINSTLELFGSWNNWTTGTLCTLATLNKDFYAYCLLDIPEGTYEYKFKFTGNCSLGRRTEWINDKSNRSHVSEYYNQLLIVNSDEYNQKKLIHTFSLMPRYYDRIATCINNYGELLTYIGCDPAAMFELGIENYYHYPKVKEFPIIDWFEEDILANNSPISYIS